MCIGMTPKMRPPSLPAAPPEPAKMTDTDVQRARTDEQARLRGMAGSGSTLLTAGKSLDDSAIAGGKLKLGQ